MDEKSQDDRLLLLKNDLAEAKSAVEAHTRLQNVLQETLRDIEKSGEALAAQRDAAETGQKVAEETKEKLDEKYDNPVYQEQKDVVETAFQACMRVVAKARKAYDASEIDVSKKELFSSDKEIERQRAEDGFKKAKAALVALPDRLKALVAKIAGLVKEAQAASDKGQDVEALIYLAELGQTLTDLKKLIVTEEPDLWKGFEDTRDAYSKIAPIAEDAAKELQISMRIRDEAKKEYEDLSDQRNLHRAVRVCVDNENTCEEAED